MEIKPEQLTLDFILDKRAGELGGEQQRWFDLKRTGTVSYTHLRLNMMLMESSDSTNWQAAINVASESDVIIAALGSLSVLY